MALITLFLGVYSLAITLAPAARARSWQVSYPWMQWLGFAAWLALAFWLHQQSALRLPNRDPYLIPLLALLSGWGLLSIWRLFPSQGLKQTIWLALSFGLFGLGLRLPSSLDFLRRYKYIWLTGGLLLTAMTLIFGTNPLGYGPRLWLGCCGIYLQPSEPLKLLLIIYLAAYLADRQLLLGQLWRTKLPDRSNSSARSRLGILLPLLAPTLVLVGVAVLLMLVQRDLGTASIFLFLYAVIVYVASGDRRILWISVVVLALAAVLGYGLFDVVRLRVDAWLNPWSDPSGRSYQIVQSLLAIANGGLFGRGPGMGNPGLVPVPQSDFIFAAITEETGLVGALALILGYALLANRGLRTALNASSPFSRLLAAGLTAYLVGQSILIMGGNLRLLPLTGVTLPFVSYGGSSLLTTTLSMLVLTQISQQSTAGLPDQSEEPAILLHPRPYLELAAFLITGLAATAVLTGWWTVYRGPGLLTRTDNARRAIADRFVRRGSLLDRNYAPLTETSGALGDLTRRYLVPELGPVTGYTHPTYGQAGLESSLDPILRGNQGNPGLLVWQEHLLYGQPPPGLNVRLSLDLTLQNEADRLLADHRGAIVLLNAENGEILALASHPTFDPNQLDQNWNDLVKDSHAPLLNRSTLGLYPPGPILGVFLLAAAREQGPLPSLPSVASYTVSDFRMNCAEASPAPAENWQTLIAAGCPGAAAELGNRMGSERLLALFQALGLGAEPHLYLPAVHSPLPTTFSDPRFAALGLPFSNTELRISPMQLALAAASLSSQGMRPAAHLVLTIDTPGLGWVLQHPLDKPERALEAAAAQTTATELADPSLPIWHSLAQGIAGSPSTPTFYTWFVGGTLSSWQGSPMTVVVLIEEDNVSFALSTGKAVLEAALKP